MLVLTLLKFNYLIALVALMPGSDGGSGESDVMYICLRYSRVRFQSSRVL